MAMFLQEKVACGKKTCGKCGGTRFVHGPYWYAYWRDAKGRMRKRYLGKERRARWGPGDDSTTPPPLTTARKRKTRTKPEDSVRVRELARARSPKKAAGK